MSRKLRLLKIFTINIAIILAINSFVSKEIYSQDVVDKTVAAVSSGASKPELITYSDLLWQLALEPETPLSPPNPDDLNRALQTLINLRLFALEAQRLPAAELDENEVTAQIKRILATFTSSIEFERRLRLVGFESIQDDNFERMIRQRVAIEKYIDFRFRTFVVVTPDEEKKYYDDVFTPDFRRRNPGLLLPKLEEVQQQINRILSETKVEEDIERFLDDAKRRADIVILFDVD